MKAIILAGGSGSRLYPLTQVSSKQLQAVYDKPMIYYPLTIIMASGINEVCIITTPNDHLLYKKLLGDGSQWGISIRYIEQLRPEGIAQAFILAEDFIGQDNVALLLGDNVFSGGRDFPLAISSFMSGATIFAYHVKTPQPYAVVEFDTNYNVVAIEEKPTKPKSNYAVPGVYIYDNNVVDIAKRLRPSHRGELEITDVNNEYLRAGTLNVRRLSRGFVWIDAGTSSALHEASSYVETIERRQGIKIGCPEEAALTRGFISIDQFMALIQKMPNCEYREYLRFLSREWKFLR